MNQYEILTDHIALSVANDILRQENQVLQEIIHTMMAKENDLVESYEVEIMMVDTLQEYLKTVEQDYSKLVMEEDIKIQQLKEERYQLKLKEYYRQKEITIDKVESEWLKQNLDVLRKD